jgi:hypothetical protein
VAASSGRAWSCQAARQSDQVHSGSQCNRPMRSRAARRRVRVHGVGAVEPVQSGVGRRVVETRGGVTEHTARASATDQREVGRRDGARLTTSHVRSRGTRSHIIGEVVDDEPCNEPRHLDARRRRSSRRRAVRQAEPVRDARYKRSSRRRAARGADAPSRTT